MSCVAVIWSIGSDVRAQVSSTPTVEGTPDAVSQPFGGINLDRLRRADFLSRVGFRDAETARSSGVPSSDIQSGSNQLGPGGGKGKASAQSACPHGCKSSFCPHRSGRFFLPTDGPDSAVAKDGLDGKEANLSFPHRLINAYVSPGDEAEESSTDRPSGVSRSSYNLDDKSQGLSSGGATGGASGGGESRGVIPFVSSPPFPLRRPPRPGDRHQGHVRPPA